MKKTPFGILVVFLAAMGLLFSCSDNDGAGEKNAIERMSDDAAKKVSDKILEPVESARDVQEKEDNRLKALQQKMEE